MQTTNGSGDVYPLTLTAVIFGVKMQTWLMPIIPMPWQSPTYLEE
jgi:hypothetical protein